MRKYLTLVLCLIIFWGCEPPGAQVLSKLIHHCDAMIHIIRENKTDPKAAQEKLTVYKDENAHEYASLIQELQTVSDENMKNPQFEQKRQEFTRKIYELVREAAAIGIDASF